MTGSALHSFLLEVGCEEIPDRMLDAACRDLQSALVDALTGERLLDGDGVEVCGFATPRRLAVRINGVKHQQPDETLVVTGPPVAAAFNDDGSVTRAAQGFAAGQGADVAELFRHAGPKGEVVAIRRTHKGRPAAQVLGEIVPGQVLGLRFPKSMSWGHGGPEFVRPIRWLVALLDEQVVPLTVAGVTADRTSQPRRGGGNQPLVLQRATDYEAVLRAAGILAERAERRRVMLEGMTAAAARCGGVIVEDAGLENTVLNMVEYPGCLDGRFPEEFLALPAEVLTTTLRHHQHCFSVADSDGGLIARFVAVVNAPHDPDGAIRAGYERVIAGRLADARFFFDEDRQQPLAEHAAMLERTRFHADLGSYAQKVGRMKKLVADLAQLAAVDDQVGSRAVVAAGLSKCDLATQMEKEFPELQGKVGGLYARQEGAAEPVWRAIYEHYAPEGLEDPLPQDAEGVLVALADRLDNLVGLMGIGVVPKGSRDPFALRRAALGVVRLLAEGPLRLSVGAALSAAREAYADATVPWAGEPQDLHRQVLDFLEGRVRHLFEKGPGGHRYDSVSAVLAAGWDDLADAGSRLKALSALRGQEDFEALAAASKRIRNILTKARDGGGDIAETISENLLQEDAEKLLHAASIRVGQEVEMAYNNGDHRSVLAAVAALRPQVDAFFDAVLVMVDDADLRRNRLALLAQVADLYGQEADFAEIVVEGQS